MWTRAFLAPALLGLLMTSAMAGADMFLMRRAVGARTEVSCVSIGVQTPALAWLLPALDHPVNITYERLTPNTRQEKVQYSVGQRKWSEASSLDQQAPSGLPPVLDHRWNSFPEVWTNGSSGFQSPVHFSTDRLHVSVLTRGQAHLALSTTSDPTKGGNYLVTIGNQVSEVWRCDDGVPAGDRRRGCILGKQQNKTGPVLGERWVHLGLSLARTNLRLRLLVTAGKSTLVEWTDTQPIQNVQFISFRTEGSKGRWRLHHYRVLVPPAQDTALGLSIPEVGDHVTCLQFFYFLPAGLQTSVRVLDASHQLTGGDTWQSLRVEVEVPPGRRDMDHVVISAPSRRSSSPAPVFALSENVVRCGVGDHSVSKVSVEDASELRRAKCVDLTTLEFAQVQSRTEEAATVFSCYGRKLGSNCDVTCGDTCRGVAVCKADVCSCVRGYTSTSSWGTTCRETSSEPSNLKVEGVVMPYDVTISWGLPKDYKDGEMSTWSLSAQPLNSSLLNRTLLNPLNIKENVGKDKVFSEKLRLLPGTHYKVSVFFMSTSDQPRDRGTLEVMVPPAPLTMPSQPRLRATHPENRTVRISLPPVQSDIAMPSSYLLVVSTLPQFGDSPARTSDKSDLERRVSDLVMLHSRTEMSYIAVEVEVSNSTWMEVEVGTGLVRSTRHGQFTDRSFDPCCLYRAVVVLISQHNLEERMAASSPLIIDTLPTIGTVGPVLPYNVTVGWKLMDSMTSTLAPLNWTLSATPLDSSLQNESMMGVIRRSGSVLEPENMVFGAREELALVPATRYSVTVRLSTGTLLSLPVEVPPAPLLPVASPRVTSLDTDKQTVMLRLPPAQPDNMQNSSYFVVLTMEPRSDVSEMPAAMKDVGMSDVMMKDAMMRARPGLSAEMSDVMMKDAKMDQQILAALQDMGGMMDTPYYVAAEVEAGSTWMEVELGTGSVRSGRHGKFQDRPLDPCCLYRAFVVLASQNGKDMSFEVSDSTEILMDIDSWIFKNTFLFSFLVVLGVVLVAAAVALVVSRRCRHCAGRTVRCGCVRRRNATDVVSYMRARSVLFRRRGQNASVSIGDFDNEYANH